MANFKETRFRSQKYMDFLKTQPCMVSGYEASEMGGQAIDPAHLGTRGRGLKEHDFYCIPLKHDLHTAMDGNIQAFWMDVPGLLASAPRHSDLARSHALVQYLKWVTGIETDKELVEAVEDLV